MKIADITNGVSSILFGIDDTEPQTLTLDEARGAALAVAAASVIGASMYTRKRVYEGKPPMMSILF